MGSGLSSSAVNGWLSDPAARARVDRNSLLFATRVGDGTTLNPLLEGDPDAPFTIDEQGFIRTASVEGFERSALVSSLPDEGTAVSGLPARSALVTGPVPLSTSVARANAPSASVSGLASRAAIAGTATASASVSGAGARLANVAASTAAAKPNAAPVQRVTHVPDGN